MSIWKVTAPETVKAADKVAALAAARKQVTVAKVVAAPPPPPPPPPSSVADPVGPFTVKSGGNTGVSWNAGSQDSGVKPVFQKLDVSHNTNCNIQIMAWRGNGASEISPPAVVEDVICTDANAVPSGSSNGTAEANLWVGGTANVKRAHLDSAGVMNLWTGATCHDSTFEDVTALNAPVGIYMEHDTVNCRFTRGKIQARGTGINVEWWYGGHGSHDCVVENYEIDTAGDRAIFLDAGTYGFTIRDCVIHHGDIWLPNHRVVDKPNVVTNCRRPDGSDVPVHYHDNGIG